MMHRSNSGNLSGFYALGVITGGMLALHPGVFTNVFVVVLVIALPSFSVWAVSRARDREAEERYQQNRRRRRRPTTYYVS